MVAAIEAFVVKRPLDCEKRNVLKHTQYIGEAFGYALAVRDSKYLVHAGRRASKLNPIERALPHCTTHE